jgi:hypothetical protein
MFLSIGNAENVNRQVFGENKTKYLIFLSIDTAILLLCKRQTISVYN